MLPKTARNEKLLSSVIEIPVGAIKPNRSQPRVSFDDYELSQLAVSIKQNGMLQPITVRRLESFGYEIVSGERRLRAAKLINLEYVPCIVIETDDKNSAVLAILENIQRSDLNYIEEAAAIRNLIEHFGLTQEECAAKLGIAQSTVANKLRLLKLGAEEKEAVLRYRLNERQARSLLRLPPDKRQAAIERISANQLNTQQSDKLVDELLEEKSEQRTKKSWAYKQVKLYINTFDHTIERMKKAGIDCMAKQSKTEDFVEYLVRIPLK